MRQSCQVSHRHRGSGLILPLVGSDGPRSQELVDLTIAGWNVQIPLGIDDGLRWPTGARHSRPALTVSGRCQKCHPDGSNRHQRREPSERSDFHGRPPSTQNVGGRRTQSTRTAIVGSAMRIVWFMNRLVYDKTLVPLRRASRHYFVRLTESRNGAWTTRWKTGSTATRTDLR